MTIKTHDIFFVNFLW